MIENFSTWAKNLTLAVVIVSLFEMLIPNNKTKKYIKVIMGLYIIFNIISPFIGKDFSFEIDSLIENSKNEAVSSTSVLESDNKKVDQKSMNVRLEQICKEELEKDIKNKMEDKGYVVNRCDVDVEVDTETRIEKITLVLEKAKNDNSTDSVNENSSNILKKSEDSSDSVENRLVEEIQKIKKVQIGNKTSEEKEEENQKKEVTGNLSSQEINQIKNFLIEEYEVSEKCLKIN